MDEWNEVMLNEGYAGAPITRINGIELPNEYIRFMGEHNGGEGDLGNTWLVLFRIDELSEINGDYEVSKYLPGCIIIGTNGSGELYGVNEESYYFNVPDLMDLEGVRILGKDIVALPKRINALWK